MNKIRLLRVIPDLQMGGVQRMLMRTLEHLIPLGITAEICCQGAERGQLADHFEAQGIAVHHIPFNSRMDPIGLWRLRQLVMQREFHIVHGHMYPSNMAANIALAGLKNVKIVNGYHSQRPVSGAGQGRMVRWTRRFPAAWIAVSESVREPLVSLGVPLEKIHVIYNGIEIKKEPAPVPERPAGAALELVWAGRFVRQKRHFFMLEVMQACKEKGIPVNLTLVGNGPYLHKAIARVADSGLAGIVRFMGIQDDVWPFLAAADLFISTSDREGFSNALIECCAAGRGFLASDIPPHRELVGNTAAGLILDYKVEDWVEAIDGLIKDRSRIAAMGTAAYGLIRNYTAQETARQTVELYQKLVSAN